MAEVGGIAALALAVVALLGPFAILLGGRSVVKWALVLLFTSGMTAMPLAAASEPPDFRGTALIIVVVLFVFGLLAINIAGALRAPRRGR